MTIGSPCARPWRDGATSEYPAVAAFQACALALSLAPSAAWAASGEVGDAAVGDVPAPAVPSDGQPVAQADESPASDDPAPDSSADGTLDAVPPRQTRARPEALREEDVAGTEAAGGPGGIEALPTSPTGGKVRRHLPKTRGRSTRSSPRTHRPSRVVPPRRSRQAASPRSRPRRPRRALRFLPDSNMREPPCMRAPGNPLAYGSFRILESGRNLRARRGRRGRDRGEAACRERRGGTTREGRCVLGDDRVERPRVFGRCRRTFPPVGDVGAPDPSPGPPAALGAGHASSRNASGVSSPGHRVERPIRRRMGQGGREAGIRPAWAAGCPSEGTAGAGTSPTAASPTSPDAAQAALGAKDRASAQAQKQRQQGTQMFARPARDVVIGTSLSRAWVMDGRSNLPWRPARMPARFSRHRITVTGIARDSAPACPQASAIRAPARAASDTTISAICRIEV